MKKFASAATRGPSIIAGASSRPATRKGFLARIVEALHESRRLDAARVIHRYRHLIAEEFFEQPKIIAINSDTPEESNANADRDNSRADADRRALQDA
ncbi:MAG TPA: hypothetical protein VGD75_15285 [Bradyrhizobium sp.]